METCQIQNIVLYVLLLICILFIIVLVKQRDELKKNVVTPIDIDVEKAKSDTI